jgi:hypothetical protein
LSGWNSKFDRLDARFDRLEAGLDRLESKFDRLDVRWESVLEKMDSQFKWLVGIQFGVLFTVIGVLLAR